VIDILKRETTLIFVEKEKKVQTLAEVIFFAIKFFAVFMPVAHLTINIICDIFKLQF